MYPLLVSCGVSGFGQHRHPDATLSLKWIDVNGSLLQSQMPQARTDRQPTSLPLSLSSSQTLSLWHKMICHSEQEYALQGGRWHQFISAGFIQNIVSPSGRKQIKQTRGQMESKEGKREEKRTKKNKQWDFFCQPLQSGERIHVKRSARFRESPVILSAICMHLSVLSLTVFLSEQDPATTSSAPALIILQPSIYLPLPHTPRPQSRPPFFKLVPPLLSCSPWSPLWSLQVLLLHSAFYIDSAEYH